MTLSEANGVRNSCDAVATNARRACSCSRRRCCIVANARLRSPISSWPSSGLSSASGPMSDRRSAVSRSRRRRRMRRPASSRPTSSAPASPAAAATVKARLTTAVASWTSLNGLRAATITGWSWIVSGKATSASARRPSPVTTLSVLPERAAAAAVLNRSVRSGSVLTSTSPRGSSTLTSAPLCRARTRAARRRRSSPATTSPARSEVSAPRSLRRESAKLLTALLRRRWLSGESSVTAATARVKALTMTSTAMTRARRPRCIAQGSPIR